MVSRQMFCSFDPSNAIYVEAALVELNLVNAVLMENRDKIEELMTLILEVTLNERLREGIPSPMFMNNRLPDYSFTFFNHSLLMLLYL